jgi:hypothetical protein
MVASFFLHLLIVAQLLRKAGSEEVLLTCFILGIALSDNFSCGTANAFGYHLVIFLPVFVAGGVLARQKEVASIAEPVPAGAQPLPSAG